MTPNARDFAKLFDHTLLKPEATAAQIETLCKEAMDHAFCTICVNGTWIPLAASLLKGSDVLPITVVGFPLGAMTTTAKAFETEDAIKNGAKEIDMVLNVGFLKSQKLRECEDDVRAVVKASGSAPVKVIIETSLLSPEEIRLASKISEQGGAAFVKTSTGFGSRGASLDDIRLMKESISSKMLIKASGGIRTLELAESMQAAGAHRIGSSATVQILADWKKKHGVKA
jgi:deoxyribose-phosphate aldolase